MNRATSPTGWARNPDGSPGWTWNPLSGCENHTPEGLCLGGLFPCYAWKLAHGRLKPLYLANGDMPGLEGWSNIHISTRFSDEGLLIGHPPEKPGYVLDTLPLKYNDPFYPRFWEERLTPLHIPRKAGSLKKGIFVCDMGELFGDWIPRSWQEQVFNAIKANPDYRFYLLTKQPQNLIKFSPFPDNAWVGVTATNDDMFNNACFYLEQIEARVKYISFEPLLRFISDDVLDYWIREKHILGWLIIGACTGTKKDMEELCKRYPELSLMSLCLDVDRRNRYITKWTLQPKIEWVREIVEAADKAGVKVFLKDNLKPLLNTQGLQDNRFWRDLRNEGLEPLHTELRQEMPK